MFGNYLQQMTSADDIFRCFFLGALRVNGPLINLVMNNPVNFVGADSLHLLLDKLALGIECRN